MFNEHESGQRAQNGIQTLKKKRSVIDLRVMQHAY